MEEENKECPKCERMKSRNESFEESNSDDQVAATRRNNKSNGNNNTDDDDDAFVTYESSDEDCLQFFDATQFLNNQHPRGIDNQSNDSQPNNSRSSKAEEELQEAMAYSGALVGENVLDSPTNNDDRESDSRESSTLAPSIPCFRDVRSNISAGGEMDPGLSAGLVAQGFAWVRNQRELRRRRYLQYQAEQQLRKIRAARNAAKQGKDSSSSGNKGLLSNPIFQNIASSVVGGSTDAETGDLRRANSSRSDPDKDLDEFLDAEDGIAAQATVSQSGAGYSVELAVSFSEEEEDATWIPPVRIEEEEGLEEGASYCLLNEDLRQQVAQHVLPSGIAYAKWKRVYSLARDGDSFDTCLRLVKEHSQTLMIVRTSKDEFFGGFADAAWEQPHFAGAQFYGGPGACLFTVLDLTKPKIKAYKWTGANRYIQLTDNHRKLLAFGGGGDEGSFGLCVESDFQRGSTGPCETFGNEPLCTEENFSIVDVEIFGFLLGQF